jgi:hypothetical protein
MFTANYESMGQGYHIVENDSDGVGKTCIRIYSSGLSKDMRLAEDVSRMVLLALNMEGGIDAATKLLRAETIKQRA